MTKSKALAAVVEAARKVIAAHKRQPYSFPTTPDLKALIDSIAALDAAPDEDAREAARRLFFSLKFRAFPVTELDVAEDIDVIADALTAARSAK